MQTSTLQVQKLNPVESYNARINDKITILTKYLRKDEEGLAMVNVTFSDARSFDRISEENLRTHLRLKAMIVSDIASYKSRIADLRSQRLQSNTL